MEYRARSKLARRDIATPTGKRGRKDAAVRSASTAMIDNLQRSAQSQPALGRSLATQPAGRRVRSRYTALDTEDISEPRDELPLLVGPLDIIATICDATTRCVRAILDGRVPNEVYQTWSESAVNTSFGLLSTSSRDGSCAAWQ
ncbi:hypothetical protein DTO166G4_4437 [Paecilomyces variotii]|nr:hypothetical protein DTO166G4_4437 [Paecilomyces variotii]KAJ9229961.1 hypothetical protein DTO166G5_7580 [Paecilomyces variotii]KAJ9299190.1 hypothetical protein DTO217A2_8240 [Paecilomyces variotii]